MSASVGVKYSVKLQNARFNNKDNFKNMFGTSWLVSPNYKNIQQQILPSACCVTTGPGWYERVLITFRTSVIYANSHVSYLRTGNRKVLSVKRCAISEEWLDLTFGRCYCITALLLCHFERRYSDEESGNITKNEQTYLRATHKHFNTVRRRSRKVRFSLCTWQRLTPDGRRNTTHSYPRN